jgi:hypothetical protein
MALRLGGEQREGGRERSLWDRCRVSALPDGIGVIGDQGDVGQQDCGGE